MTPPPDLENQINGILDELYTGIITALQEHGALSYFYGDLTGQQALGRSLLPRISTQPAIDFSDSYLDELRRGGSTINGEFIPWLEKYGAEKNSKPLYDTIMKGINEGKPLGRWEYRDAEVYPKNTVAADIQDFMDTSYRSGSSRIARTEAMNILSTASLDRYEKIGVEQVKVSDGCGCSTCALVNGETWDIDEARQRVLEHPICKRTFIPVVKGYDIPDVGKPSPMPEDDLGSREH